MRTALYIYIFIRADEVLHPIRPRPLRRRSWCGPARVWDNIYTYYTKHSVYNNRSFVRRLSELYGGEGDAARFVRRGVDVFVFQSKELTYMGA